MVVATAAVGGSRQVRVSGRVVSVRPNADGDEFSVTVGPPPDLFWFRSHRPPKLGQKVTLVGYLRTREDIGKGTVKGSISALEDVDCQVLDEEYPRRLVPAAWLKRASEVMRRPLYRYQIDGAGWMASRIAESAGGILGDDPGCGKSAQTVAAIVATRAFPAVIVCPSSLKAHWAREFGWANLQVDVHIMEGRKPEPVPLAEVYVINYELLQPREEQLRHMRPRLYVFDEAQNLKEPGATGNHRAAVACRLVAEQKRGAILLTGTPIMNRPSELWRLLHLCDPKAWPTFEAFSERYLEFRAGNATGRAIKTAAGGLQRLDELQAAVAPLMLRRMKHQVLQDLPPKSRRSALVRLDDASLSHYRRAEADVVAWLFSLGQAGRAQAAAKAQSIVKLTMLRRIAAIGKLRAAIPEYLSVWKNRHASEPLVIFGYHREVMLGLWQICHRLGMRVVGIGGGESTEKREGAILAFQRGLADVFLAPIKSAGVGLNLQRASEALFVERVWTPSGMIQAEDRIHRIGSTRPVTITYMDAAGTVDEHLAEVLEEKQKLIRAVVDDNAQASESLSTVDAVLKRMNSSRRSA